MRVIGLLFILLAGPVSASDDRYPSGLARFAYANTLAFQTSFEAYSPEPARLTYRPRRGDLPDLQPVTLVATDRIVDAEIRQPDGGSTEQHANIPAATIEAVSAMPAAEVLPSARPEATRLASLPEPVNLPAREPASDNYRHRGEAPHDRCGRVQRYAAEVCARAATGRKIASRLHASTRVRSRRTPQRFRVGPRKCSRGLGRATPSPISEGAPLHPRRQLRSRQRRGRAHPGARRLSRLFRRSSPSRQGSSRVAGLLRRSANHRIRKCLCSGPRRWRAETGCRRRCRRPQV